MTLADARIELRSWGIVITKHGEEYRLVYKGLGDREYQEASAYYTCDLYDAVATGKAMAKTGRIPSV